MSYIYYTQYEITHYNDLASCGFGYLFTDFMEENYA